MSNRPMVRLGEVLQKSTEWIQLHPEKTYKEITVRLWGKGVTLRKEVSGAEIPSTSRLQVHANQFIISKIDARNGASGLIPSELEGGIVSTDFPVFTTHSDRLEPRYLGWLCKTNHFIDLCKGASEGTTNRVRLKEERFLATVISLPPMTEQRRLADRIDALVTKVEEAKVLRKKTSDHVNQLLVCMAHRKDVTDGEKAGIGWTRVTLGEVIKPCSEPVRVDTSMKYPNLGIFSFGRGTFEKTPIDGLVTSASTLFCVHARQFIYSRLFAFEGAYGIVPTELDGHFVSNEYPTFECNETRILPEFLEAYFKSPQLWKEIASGSKGLGDRRQRVHPKQVLSREFWLPTVEWQRHIVAVREQLKSKQADRNVIESELNALIPAILDRAFRGEL